MNNNEISQWYKKDVFSSSISASTSFVTKSKELLLLLHRKNKKFIIVITRKAHRDKKNITPNKGNPTDILNYNIMYLKYYLL
jgi:hypothetical protein